MKTVNSYVGTPVKRLEDFRFLTGRGQYVGDLKRENLLHAVILRSPMAHGVIVAIDTARARALPGVHAVITAADIGTPVPRIPMRQEPMPELLRCEQPVIAEGKVRYAGEPVALVVAESADRAEDALQAIELSLEALPAVVDGRAKNQPLLFDDIENNIATTMKAVRGDADAAFKAHKDYVRRERFAVHRHTAVALEPRGLLAEWDAKAGRMTLHGATKVPFTNRRILARHLGLKEDAVTLIENDVGGAFGARGEFYPEDFLMAGQMDRGPARESARHQSCARGRVRARDRLRRRWPHRRAARTCRCRYRRLYSHRRRDARAQHHPGAVGSLPHPAYRRRCRAASDQQDAGRHLSRAGTL